MLCRLLLVLSLVCLPFQNVGAVSKVRSTMKDNTSGPVVNTNVGSIRGLRAEDGDYSMFMGIPYAEVDKDNVFGPSTPYPKFESTFDAYDDSAICPQVEEFNHTIVGSLDCLHLNVYVPDSAGPENRLPVFVSIYGGGFTIGFAGRFLYGPSFLIRHDVIVVTLNYRVGAYGFMCLDIPEVPGNQGLKDQIIALRWIKDNIEAFGGDNTKITIGGNSAGGMSADFHLHYGTEELFHKIIPQSGVVSIATAMRELDPTPPLKIAEHLNYTPTDLKDALLFLNTVSPQEVIAVVEEIGLTFRPCIEKEFDDVDNYITQHPLNMPIPRVKDIDVLIGFNDDEMYAVYSSIPDISFGLVDYVETSLNNNFDFGDNHELHAEMKAIITQFYLGDEIISAEVRQQITDMASDFSYNHGTLRTVKKYLDNGVEAMYLYVFAYSGGRNFVKHRENITGGSAAHADELGYLFDISYMEKPLDPEDELIVDRMTELWANFVKYGNPTPEITELLPVQWPRVTRERWHYLQLDTQLRVATRPFHDRMAFLDLFFRTNEQYQRGNLQMQEPSAGNNVILGLSLPLLFLVHILPYLGP